MGVLTKEERRLIDEAVASGNVTKVDRGVSSFPGYRYDEDEGKLKSVDPEFYKKHSDWGRKKQNPKVEDRRMDILAMYNAGKTYEQMMSKHKVALHTVHGDMRVLRSRGHHIDMKQKMEMIEHDKRCDDAVKAAANGCSSIAEICRKMGLSAKALNRSFQKSGRIDEYRKLAAASYKKKTGNAEPRRMSVKKHLAEGMTHKQIAAKIGVTRAVVSKDVTWLRDHGNI